MRDKQELLEEGSALVGTRGHKRRLCALYEIEKVAHIENGLEICYSRISEGPKRAGINNPTVKTMYA